MAEQNVEQQIQVRQVTDVHANWNEEGRGEPGKFSSLYNLYQGHTSGSVERLLGKKRTLTVRMGQKRRKLLQAIGE